MPFEAILTAQAMPILFAMLKRGVDVKVAQERLGHADISTTLNIYTHVLPSSAKEAANKIGELVYAM